MNFFILMTKYFWAVAIVFTVVQGFYLKYRSKRNIINNPELSESYPKLIKWFCFWMGLPWVVMGVGILSGDVSTVFDYFRPKEGNIYVLAFFGVLFFEYTLGTLWLFARGGAEVLAKHPGFIQMRGTKTKDITNPTQIKIFWLLCLIGGVAAFFMMWHSNIEIPKFR